MITISAYQSYTNKAGLCNPGCFPYDTDLETELQRFRDGYYKQIIDEVRAITDKEQRTLFKAQRLPSITISCTTKEWRKTENVTSQSGFICFDIDGDANPQIDDWEKLRNDIGNAPRCAAAFLSASGKGLAFICRIAPSQHLDVFQSMEYDLKKIGITLDRSGKDIVRLRFVTYDPGLICKNNIMDTELTIPSDEWMEQKKHPTMTLKPSSKVDSYQTFLHAVQHAEKTESFTDGHKHLFLMRLAVYANRIGMDEEFCGQMVIKHYGHLSGADLLKPIKNVYRSYKEQHGTIHLPKPLYSTRILKWLLSKADKGLLKQYLHLYGKDYIQGESDYKIGVTSKPLVFLMSLACPQYTWTTHNTADEYYTDADCKAVFPAKHYIDSCNGNRVFCHHDQQYPSTWN
jgi:VirE N-terminal domain